MGIPWGAGGISKRMTRPSGGGFGEVAEDDGVVEIHAAMCRTFSAQFCWNVRPRALPWAIACRTVGAEELEAHEIPNLWIEELVTADEAHFLEELAGEEGDDGAPVGLARVVEMDGVVDLGIEHPLEDDLAGFLLGEGLERQALVAESGGIERGEILEFAVIAAGKLGQRDVERVGIFRGVVGFHLDDERVLAVGAAAHGDVLEVTPSLWMDSTNSMNADVPRTETVSFTSLPKYMRRRPRPNVCSGRMFDFAA